MKSWRPRRARRRLLSENGAADRQDQVLARWLNPRLSWRQSRPGIWSASLVRHKSDAEHCASIPAASLVLMDMNIYLVEDITSG